MKQPSILLTGRPWLILEKLTMKSNKSHHIKWFQETTYSKQNIKDRDCLGISLVPPNRTRWFPNAGQSIWMPFWEVGFRGWVLWVQEGRQSCWVGAGGGMGRSARKYRCSVSKRGHTPWFQWERCKWKVFLDEVESEVDTNSSSGWISYKIIWIHWPKQGWLGF